VRYRHRYLRPRLYNLETVFVRSQDFLKKVAWFCMCMLRNARILQQLQGRG
jgi:hypothetical protein